MGVGRKQKNMAVLMALILDNIVLRHSLLYFINQKNINYETEHLI